MFAACKDLRGWIAPPGGTHFRTRLHRPPRERPQGVPSTSCSCLPWIVLSYNPSAFLPGVVLLEFVTSLQPAPSHPPPGGHRQFVMSDPCGPTSLSGPTIATIPGALRSCLCSCAPLQLREWGYTRRVFPVPAAPAFAFTPWPREGSLLLHSLKNREFCSVRGP